MDEQAPKAGDRELAGSSGRGDGSAPGYGTAGATDGARGAGGLPPSAQGDAMAEGRGGSGSGGGGDGRALAGDAGASPGNGSSEAVVSVAGSGSLAGLGGTAARADQIIDLAKVDVSGRSLATADSRAATSAISSPSGPSGPSGEGASASGSGSGSGTIADETSPLSSLPLTERAQSPTAGSAPATAPAAGVAGSADAASAPIAASDPAAVSFARSPVGSPHTPITAGVGEVPESWLSAGLAFAVDRPQMVWLLLLLLLVGSGELFRRHREVLQRSRAAQWAFAGLAAGFGLYSLALVKQAAVAVLWTDPEAAEAQSASPPGGVKWLTDERQALAQSRARHAPVFVDFAASWCETCREIERTVLADPEVQRRLSRFVPLKLDVSEQTPLTADQLKRYGVAELPALLFLDPGGAVRESSRSRGLVTKAEFLKTIDGQ
jgi:thiol-disulfide isomerase/thioredoxin